MEAYEANILEWRQGAEVSLRGDESWLALVALHWLTPGTVSIGSAPDSGIRLPAACAPGTLGWLIVEGSDVRLKLKPATQALVNGRHVHDTVMLPDSEKAPTRVRVGRLTMIVVERSGRLGLRVWDRESPRRSAFPARRWFPVDPSFRIQTSLIPGWPNTRVRIESTQGDVEDHPVERMLQFEHLGIRCLLVPFSEDEEGIFLAFTDRTTGAQTYPGGRYLHAPPPIHGVVELDFNRAYNPPCAFTPFATCPLAPATNSLPLDILAGELFPPNRES
jgi:uncharacterized protein (DUF1684 family)